MRKLHGVYLLPLFTRYAAFGGLFSVDPCCYASFVRFLPFRGVADTLGADALA